MEGEENRSLTDSAERIQNPFIFLLVMAKNVDVAVIRAQPETAVSTAVPLVQDLHHLKHPGMLCVGTEPKGPFVSLVASVTLNVQSQWHGRPPKIT